MATEEIIPITAREPFRLLATANSTATSITAKSVATDKPVIGSGGVFETPGNASRIQFFGTDADGELFDAEIGVLDKVVEVNGDAICWVPRPLLLVRCTLASGVPAGGRDGVLNAATTYFADTITLVTDYLNGTGYKITSPADNARIAEVIVDHLGAAFGYILFDRDTAASANALVKAF